MKNLTTLGCALAVALCMTTAVSAKSSTPKAKWQKGWVSESKCGAKGAAVGHEECAKKCAAAGEHMVFVNEFSHKVLNVDNPDTLKDHLGHRVALQGNIDDAAGSIHVDKVNPLPEKASKAAASMDEMHK
jgi:hypothetical protein